MHESCISKSFVFTAKEDHIYHALMDVVGFFEQNLPGYAQELLPAVKLIVIELVTNAIKHSGQAHVYFDLLLDDDCISIVRKDKGKPVSFVTEQMGTISKPFDTSIAEKIKLYGDGLNALFVEILNDGTLKFTSEEFVTAYSGVLNLSEHFGLLIISRSGSNFTYHFNERNRQNEFKVIIQYNHLKI